MTLIDNWLQLQRIRKVIRYIPSGSIVLDIGCHNGELFKAMGSRLRQGLGIDPLLPADINKDNIQLTKGIFPVDWNNTTSLDCITLLAVLEHIPVQTQKPFAQKCYSLLHPGGLLIITVPSRKTDRLLSLLQKLRLIKGMSLEEHYGFDPHDTRGIFEAEGFSLLKHESFQLQFNNLFIFQKQNS